MKIARKTMPPEVVYVRSFAAILLPAVTVWFLRGVYFDVLSERAREASSARWGLAVATVTLVVIELRLLSTLVQLVLSGGRIEVFQARLADPFRIALRRRRRLKFSAAFGSIVVASAIIEGAFRLLDIQPPPPPRPAPFEYWAVDNSINALGIREPWDSIPVDDPRLRIAFLGDSIVYGDGAQPEECFCHLVEPMLAGARSEGVRTINLGFRGTDPAWQREKFLGLKDAIRPDVVVQIVYPNDLGIEMHRRLDEIYRTRDSDLWTGDWSYILRFSERTIRYWIAWKRTIDYFQGGSSSQERQRAWVKFEADVRACKQTVEESGATYALVLFPWLVRLQDYALKDVHDHVRKFASRLGVPYLDLLQTYSGYDAETLRVSLANEHPNAFGHRLAAERLARFLREEVLSSLPPQR